MGIDLVNSPGKNKIEWIQYLRIFSALAVINLHVLYQSFLLSEKTDTLELYFYNFFIFAVPVFIMITGFLWLSFPQKKFDLIKAEKRIIIPLISFGFVFALMEVYFNEHTMTLKSLFTAAGYVISDEGWAHLWYLYALIGLYLVIPVLRATLKEYGDRFAVISIIIIVIVNSFCADLSIYHGFKFGVKLPVSGIYVAYLLIGYYVPKIRISNVALLINWLLLIVADFYFSYVGVRLGTNSFVVCWLATTIYYTFFHTSSIWRKLYCSLVDNCASLTFGVYLVHMLFINVFFKLLHLNPYNYLTVLFWGIEAIIVFLLSAGCTYLIRKTPVINKVFQV